MMVDPAMIVEYAIPIIVITLAVILGQAVFGTFGVILSGKPLKTAMQCGFSLTQIGEFAFIIASLGVSLHVTSDFLYPIVVAVSVITTFLTPYMIRFAEPASTFCGCSSSGIMEKNNDALFFRFANSSESREFVEEANLVNGTYNSCLFNCQYVDYCTFFSFCCAIL